MHQVRLQRQKKYELLMHNNIIEIFRGYVMPNTVSQKVPTYVLLYVCQI